MTFSQKIREINFFTTLNRFDEKTVEITKSYVHTFTIV